MAACVEQERRKKEEEKMKKERLEAALKVGSNRGKSLDEVQFHILIHISYAMRVYSGAIIKQNYTHRLVNSRGGEKWQT